MKRSSLVALLAIGALMLIALVALIADRTNPVDEIAEEIQSHSGETPAVTETIATKVPENAVFLASTTDQENMEEWWKFFSSLDYYDPALPQDLDEDLIPQEIIYAAFPYEDEEGAFDIASALYISLDEKSLDFQEWIVSQRLAALEERNDPELEGLEEGEFPNLYTISIIPHENFLIIPSNAMAHNELLSYVYDENGEEVTTEGFTVHEDWDEVSNINDSVLWFDAGSYVDFFLNQAPERTQEATLEMLTLTAGYQENTTFLGTSKDQGKTWSGVFPTGGLDTSLVDLNEAERKVLDSIVIDPSGVVSDPGLDPFGSAMSSSNRVDDNGNVQTFGEVRPPQVNQPVTALVTDDDFRTSVSFSPQIWSSLFRGLTEYESIAYVTLDITENNSGQLSFTFYDELEELETESTEESEEPTQEEVEAGASE